MEREPNRENQKPRNDIVLKGKRYTITLNGTTSRRTRVVATGYGNAFETDRHDTELSGDGAIADLDVSCREIPFTFSPLTTTPYYYDSHKPRYLSEVFDRDDVTSQSDYADAVGQHLMGSIRDLTESATAERTSATPVRIDKFGRITINLLPYAADLDLYLLDHGVVPEASGQLRLSAS